MLDLIAGHPAAERVLRDGADALGVHVREWLAHPDCIHDNLIAQPLICLCELATWAALRESMDEVNPAMAFAGYSVGELAAYGCAGALEAAELARLARLRAAAMNAAAIAPGGLIALRGLNRGTVEALCVGQSSWVAIVNGGDAFVLGGNAEVLASLAKRAIRRGAAVTCLKVGIAAHTPLLKEATGSFALALQNSALRAPASPVVAGIDASLVTTRARAIATLAAQIAQTIEWSKCLEAMYERGCRAYFELGPGSALSRMARELLPDDIEARSVTDFRTVGGAASWLRRRGSK
jgi:[acyl-carrier-protein] S-malonyltransferase